MIYNDADYRRNHGLDRGHDGGLAVFKPLKAACIQQIRKEAGHEPCRNGKKKIWYACGYDTEVFRAADDGRAYSCQQTGIEVYGQGGVAAVKGKAAENAVQRVAEAGAQSEDEPLGRYDRSAAADSRHKTAAREGQRHGRELLRCELFPEQRRGYKDNKARRGIQQYRGGGQAHVVHGPEVADAEYQQRYHSAAYEYPCIPELYSECLAVAQKDSQGEKHSCEQAPDRNAAYGGNAHRVKSSAEKAHKAPQRSGGYDGDNIFIFHCSTPLS